MTQQPGTHRVLSAVRRALGRAGPLSDPPIPPELNEPITRLVHSDIGLPKLLARMASKNGMSVQFCVPEDLAERITELCAARGIRSVGIARSRLLDSFDLQRALQSAGIVARSWDEMDRDDSYELDAGITDVYAAVAEVGGLVIRPHSQHGRSLSLAPRTHIAIVEPRVIVGDLVDLFDKLAADGLGSGITLITGPSKTSDIEMNLVVGVHGPTAVDVLVIE